MMVIDGKEQDPGDVYRALAAAFAALPEESQRAAIDAVNGALASMVEVVLDRAGVELTNAHEHEATKAYMLVAGMARAVFASRGRTIVLRRLEGAVLATQLPIASHVDLELIGSAEGSAPIADRALEQMASAIPAANRPGGPT